MAKEPDNLVLVHLREIRSKLDDHDKRFDQVDKRFDKIDKDFDTFKFQLTHALGIAGMANLHAQHAEAKADEALARQKHLQAQMKELQESLPKL